jgi:hypothetical protein
MSKKMRKTSATPVRTNQEFIEDFWVLARYYRQGGGAAGTKVGLIALSNSGAPATVRKRIDELLAQGVS